MTDHRLEVEGFSAAEPVEDEDWIDDVRWQINYWWIDRKEHNRDGFVCEMAGSSDCLALGHTPEADGDWDYDTHPAGWDGDRICPATRYASACTVCESEDCGGWQPFDASALWKAVSVPHVTDEN